MSKSVQILVRVTDGKHIHTVLRVTVCKLKGSGSPVLGHLSGKWIPGCEPWDCRK